MTSTNGTNGTNGHTNSPIASLEEFLSQSYDFVICGGGTAGLTLAARLTENPDVTVGVIEAGKCQLGDPLVDTPAAFMQMFSNPEYEWGFRTTPQVIPNAVGTLDGKRSNNGF
jgi:choline dehydrogenase-like flavoprotein